MGWEVRVGDGGGVLREIVDLRFVLAPGEVVSPFGDGGGEPRVGEAEDVSVGECYGFIGRCWAGADREEGLKSFEWFIGDGNGEGFDGLRVDAGRQVGERL